MSDDHDPLQILGKTLEDKYRIDALAGLGGFSAVYRATHMVWNEPVAIKFFTVLQDAEPDVRERLLQDFIQEGKLMSQLSSRCAAIVQARDMGKMKVNDAGEWIPYMVLEWLDGTPLDQVISQERRASLAARSLAETVNLLEPAAIALDIAHRGNVAHRDLKPANFVVSGDPRDPAAGLKVLDFGIAKVMESQIELQEQMQLTGQHITAFTPNYGAPEQFSRNFGATGPWTDVFALTLIVLELLGNRRVLEGESFFELGVASCDEDSRPTPRTLGIEVSDAVEAVFAKALAVNPKSRYPDMGSFWRDLHSVAFPGADTWSPRTDKPSMRNLESHLHTGSARVIITPADPQAISDGNPDTINGMTFARKRSRNRKSILLAAGAVAVASLALLAFAISERRPPTAADATSAASGPILAPMPTDSNTAVSASLPAQPAPADSALASAAPPSPTANASAAPASSPQVVPRPAPRGVPPGPKTPPKPAPSGGDPWDPSSFGGRR